MKGTVTLCDGEKKIMEVELSELIEFEIKSDNVTITHLEVNVEGKKRLKYCNGSMPFAVKCGAAVRFKNFIKMLVYSGALEDEKTNLVS